MDQDKGANSSKNGKQKKSEEGGGEENGRNNGDEFAGFREMDATEEPSERGEFVSVDEIEEIGMINKAAGMADMEEDEDPDDTDEPVDKRLGCFGIKEEDSWHEGYEDDGVFKKTRILTNFWARAVVWYLLPGVLVVLLGAVIAVSRMTVRDSLQVFGHGEVEILGGGKKALEAGIGKAYLPSGSRAALRVAVLRRLLGKHLKPISGTIHLVEMEKTGPEADETRRWKLFEGDSEGMEALAANFEMPDVKEGMYRLEVVVTSPEGEIKGELPVEVFSLSSEERRTAEKNRTKESRNEDAQEKTRAKLVTFDPPKDVKRRRMTPPDGEGRIVELSAESGHRLVGELPQRLYLRAMDEKGNPERITARVGLLSGILGNKKGGDWLTDWKDTGPLGMIFLDVVPRRAFVDLGIQYRAESKIPSPKEKIEPSGADEGSEDKEAESTAKETSGGEETEIDKGKEPAEEHAQKNETENKKAAAGTEQEEDKKATYIVEEVEHRKKQRFGCRPGQLVLQVSRRTARPGESVFVEAITLPESGSMYLDVYWRGILIHTANAKVENGQAEFWVNMPDVEGFVYLQAYMDMVSPGQAVGVKALFVSKEFDREKWKKSGRYEQMHLNGAVRVIEATAGKLREMADEYVERLTLKSPVSGVEEEDKEDISIQEEKVRERELLLLEAIHLEGIARLLSETGAEGGIEEIPDIDEVLSYGLSRLEKGYHPPRLIANTLPGARIELAATKARLQRTFLSLFGVGAFGFFLILGFLISTWIKESREAEREREKLMLGCEDDEDSPVEIAEKKPVGDEKTGETDVEDNLHRTNIGADRKTGGWRMSFQIGVLVGIVIFTVISVIVLIANLVWQI